MDVTESGMVIDSSDLHYENASSPMDLTVSGMFTDLSFQQLEKTLSGIEVTESGFSQIRVSSSCETPALRLM